MFCDTASLLKNNVLICINSLHTKMMMILHFIALTLACKLFTCETIRSALSSNSILASQVANPAISCYVNN